MSRFQRAATITAISIVMAGPLWAGKKNDPNISLEFVPQQSVAGAELSVSPAVRERAVTLRVVDRRGEEDPRYLGTRTDDDDRLYTLRAVDEIVPFVHGALVRVARDGRLSVQEQAPRVLVVGLSELEITETNQAVGATFESWVRLDVELHSGAGETLWSGVGRGDATRYGKKFSNANCNEVLSDALLEAFVDALNDRELQTAWETGEAVRSDPPVEANGSRSTPSSQEATSRRSPQSPGALLQEVERLMSQGFEVDTLVDWVSQGTLNRRMGAEDLGAWKEAGVPEPVIRAALALPVR